METNTLKLSEEMTVVNIDKIYEKILSLDVKGDLVLDLAEVSKIDYVGIQLLLSLKFTMDKEGGSLSMLGLNDQILEELKQSGVYSLLFTDS